MDRSKRSKPLTVISTMISCRLRENPKNSEDEKSSGTDAAGSIAPKQFYPVREARRPPSLYPTKISVKSEKKKRSTKSAIRKPEKSLKKSKTSPKPKRSTTRRKKAETSDEDDDDTSSSGKTSDQGSDDDVSPSLEKETNEDQNDDENSDEENHHCKGGSDLTYDQIRQRNIDQRIRLFNELRIKESVSDLHSSLGIDKVGVKPKPSKRGLASVPRKKEPPPPPRKSLRLLNIEADKTLKLPEKEPTSYFFPAADTKVRPPLTDLQVSDVLDSKDDETEKVVLEKKKFLENLLSNLKTTNVSPTKKMKRSDEDVETMIEKLKINDDQVAKVTPSRIFSLAIHSSEEKLIIGVGDKTGAVGIWNVKDKHSSKNGVEVFFPHTSPVNCLTFDTFHQNKLVSTSYDGTVRSLDLESQIFSLVYGTADDDPTYTGYHCQIDANQFMVTLGSTGLVGLVDVRESNLKRSRDFRVLAKGSAKTISVHPVEKHLMLVPSNRTDCDIFDIRSNSKTLTPVSSLSGHSKSISSAFFSPVTGNSAVTVSYDNKIRLYDVGGKQEKILPRKQINHNNQTGRWLTTFKAEWHPTREDMFVVGSMSQPRKIDIFNADTGDNFDLRGDQLASICSIVKAHPTKNVVVGGNASGRVFVFAE